MMTDDFNRGNSLSQMMKTRIFGPFSKPFLLILTLSLPLLASCAFSSDEMGDTDSPGGGMLSIAKTLQTRGDLVGAVGFYQRAQEHDPQNIRTYKGLALILEQLGHVEEAANQYRTAVVVDPHDAQLRRDYGRLLLAQEHPAEARDQYMAALDIDSNDTKAINGLAIALDYLGDHTAAQQQYEKVLNDNPKNLSALNNLAYSLILSRRYAEAIKRLEPEVDNPQATAAMRQNLALAYGMAGKEPEAARVAKIDLPKEKVQKSLDYYKQQRAEEKIATAPYAEIGTYPTAAMAAAEIEKLKPSLGKNGMDLKPVIAPLLTAPGGTPRFTVRMMGCTKPEQVQDFCAYMKKLRLPCSPRGQK